MAQSSILTFLTTIIVFITFSTCVFVTVWYLIFTINQTHQLIYYYIITQKPIYSLALLGFTIAKHQRQLFQFLVNLQTTATCWK